MSQSEKGFRVMRYRPVALGLSLVLVVASLLLLAVRGLNLGIDFTGGTLLERRLGRVATAAEVQEALERPELADLELGSAVVQTLDDPRDVLIRTRTLTTAEIGRIDEVLARVFRGAQARRTEFVGPVVGAETVRNALLALLAGSGLVMVYLGFRFEFSYSVVAVLAVLHDAVISAGALSLLGWEVNAPFVAAILTIVGYSLNATIVVFDRVRELLRLRKKEPISEIVDQAVRQTLGRSVNTSLTTLFVIVALFLFGGSTIREFVFALLVGVTVGTYSSVFVAGPLWASWKERDEMRRRAARAAA